MSTDAQSHSEQTFESDHESAKDLYERRKAHINAIAQQDDEMGALARAIRTVATQE